MPFFTFRHRRLERHGLFRTASLAVAERMTIAVPQFPVGHGSDGDVNNEGDTSSKCANDNDGNPS